MYTRTSLNFIKINLFIFIISSLSCSSIKNTEQKSTKLKDFKIIVENVDNGIKIKSEKGSAWKNLSISLNTDHPQAVDEYGMTELKYVSEKKDKNLADFLFIITKTKNGIELKGIEGTAWTELKFSLSVNKKHEINQFGMISLN